MPAGEIWGSKSLKSSTFEKVFLKVRKKKKQRKESLEQTPFMTIFVRFRRTY